MALTETTGSTSITGAGSETTLFDTGVVAVNHFATMVYLNPLAAADTVIINVYAYDSGNATLRLAYSFTYTGVQTQTAVFIPFITTTDYKVTMQSTAGATHTYFWARYAM